MRTRWFGGLTLVLAMIGIMVIGLVLATSKTTTTGVATDQNAVTAASENTQGAVQADMMAKAQAPASGSQVIAAGQEGSYTPTEDTAVAAIQHDTAIDTLQARAANTTQIGASEYTGQLAMRGSGTTEDGARAHYLC